MSGFWNWLGRSAMSLFRIRFSNLSEDTRSTLLDILLLLAPLLWMLIGSISSGILMWLALVGLAIHYTLALLYVIYRNGE